MKLNCIIDTCSCIILSNADFRQKSLLDHFNATAYLHFSPEVHLELRDHAEKNLPQYIHDRKRKLSPVRFSMNEYERRMLGRVLSSRVTKENKGEIDNFLVSVDEIHQNGKSSIIFITDDEAAKNGILSNWLDCFPVIKLWSSYEVILYLYAEKIIPTKSVAVDLIKAVIHFTAPKPAERSEETTKKLTKILSTYNRRLDNIHSLLN
jgi:hypothetical protein